MHLYMIIVSNTLYTMYNMQMRVNVNVFVCVSQCVLSVNNLRGDRISASYNRHKNQSHPGRAAARIRICIQFTRK